MNESFPLWAVSDRQQSGLLLIAVALLTISLVYAIYLSRIERDPFPIFVFLGAGLAILLEPIGDIFTQSIYPHIDQVSAFTAWGRKMPLWMVPNYFFFFCMPVLLLMRYLVRPNVTARAWWLSYALVVVFVMVFEMPGINAASWKYYGDPALLSINTYPIWIGFDNAQCLLSTAVAVYLLRTTLFRGARSVVFIALVPLIIAATHIAPSIPVATATHSGGSPFILNASACITILLNILIVWTGWMLLQTRQR